MNTVSVTEVQILMQKYLYADDLEEDIVLFSEFYDVDYDYQERQDPTISIDSSPINVAENIGSIVVQVARRGDTDNTASVDFSLVSQTALAGEDFVFNSGTLTFDPEEDLKEIVIDIIDDDLDEPIPNETFLVVLSNPLGAVISADTKTVSIIDDEINVIPAVFAGFSISGLNQTVTEDVGTIDLAVELTEPAPEDVTLTFTLQPGTALPHEDFASCECAQQLLIPAGENSATITVDVANDEVYEPQETFTINLERVDSPQGVGLGQRVQSRILILDDDEPIAAGQSKIYMDSSTQSLPEENGAVFLRVIREGDLTEAASVDYLVSGVTASPGIDYEVPAGNMGTIRFESGSKFASLYIRIVNDGLAEPDEVLSLSLQNPVGAELGASYTQLAIIDNDADSFPPYLRILRTDGQQPLAEIYGGASTNGGLAYAESVVVGQSIGIHVSLVPRIEDIGKEAQVVVVVRSQGNHVQVIPEGILPLEITTIEDAVKKLVPFMQLTLSNRVDLNLLQFLGEVLTLTSEELGSYELFVGYTTENLNSGNWVFTYNDAAINLRIEEP